MVKSGPFRRLFHFQAEGRCPLFRVGERSAGENFLRGVLGKFPLLRTPGGVLRFLPLFHKGVRVFTYVGFGDERVRGVQECPLYRN